MVQNYFTEVVMDHSDIKVAQIRSHKDYASTRSSQVYVKQKPLNVDKQAFLSLGSIRTFSYQQLRKITNSITNIMLHYYDETAVIEGEMITDPAALKNTKQDLEAFTKYIKDIPVIIRQALYQVGELTSDEGGAVRFAWRMDEVEGLAHLMPTLNSDLIGVAETMMKKTNYHTSFGLLGEIAVFELLKNGNQLCWHVTTVWQGSKVCFLRAPLL